MSGSDHETLTIERHAHVVDELRRQNPRAWSALYRPNRYVYDERDQAAGNDLDNKCQSLRIAFQSVSHWQEMKRMLRDLLRFDERRRRMSIGVWMDDRIIYGESV